MSGKTKETTMGSTKTIAGYRRPLRRLALLAGLAALWAGNGPGTALAAETPTPAWSFSIAAAYPTNFAPGEPSGYNFWVINEGNAPTSGEYVFTNTIPAGLTFDESGELGERRVNAGAEQTRFPLACTVAGQTLTCKGSEPVQPGQRIFADIPVEVTSSGPETLLSEASVEGGGAGFASAEVTNRITPEPIPFGLLPGSEGVSLLAAKGDGSPASQAGSHPNQLRVSLQYGLAGTGEGFQGLHVPSGGIRDIEAVLPKGIVINPNATPKCTEAQLESFRCPDNSQIGTLLIQSAFDIRPGGFYQPLYNMVAPPGVPAEFGAEIIEGTYAHVLGKVLSNGEYRLGANVNSIPSPIGVLGAITTLWGNPSAESHDFARGECLSTNTVCPTDRSNVAFVTMPSLLSGRHSSLRQNG